MEIAKSHAEEKILNLVTETLADVYAILAKASRSNLIRDEDLERDITYVKTRFDHEGLPFVTVNLPRLGDWFDQWIWGEKVQRVAGFKPYDGLYPCFLRPVWIHFQDVPLAMMKATDYELIRCIRTLLLGLKKLNVPYSTAQTQEKLDQFLGIEVELDDFVLIPSRYTERAQVLADRLLKGYEPECTRPKHGPGAVAGGEKGTNKWYFSTKYLSLHEEWRYWEYIFPVRSLDGDGWRQGPRRARPLQLAYEAHNYRKMKVVTSPIARLLFVPKDSRGPRIISCEPKELMYIQQGVAKHLVDFLDVHDYTQGRINFDDQTVNAQLALRSSEDRRMSTIDLSDASDRVSCQLIRYLFRKDIVRKWMALRSTATMLPNGTCLPLSKFAPMGSAMCFPVESLCFWLLAVGSIWESTGVLGLALESVYVYGDDIIIANEYTELVMNVLESVGLKVNRSKSFIGNHPFRESCGVEALNGHDVTPFRVKAVPPWRSSDGSGITSWIQYAENTQKLCPRRSAFQLKVVTDLIGPIPRVPFKQAFLSIVTQDDHWDLSKYPRATWDSDRCYWKQRLLSAKNRSTLSPLTDWQRLQRDLIETALYSDHSLVVDRQSTLIRHSRSYITYLLKDGSVVGA
jgi:hypothetical protein